MNKYEYDDKLRQFGIKNQYELMEKYLYLLNEVKELKGIKMSIQMRYDNMYKTLMTYMDKYGSLDNKKGKENGVYKQI